MLKTSTKFLIQTIDDKIVHDFSFTLLTSIDYQAWRGNKIEHFLVNDLETKFPYGELINLIPVGSVEFVTQYLQKFYQLTPKPRNVPFSLFSFANRKIFNGNESDIQPGMFYKSNDVIKMEASPILLSGMNTPIPKGNYQISEMIDIESEWRCFIFMNELVGLQNYSGEFTLFPDVKTINSMIAIFKNANPTAPVAYTLDVGINSTGTFVIEVHDFFSCGLYGFSDHSVYPLMLSRWFYEYIKINDFYRIDENGKKIRIR